MIFCASSSKVMIQTFPSCPDNAFLRLMEFTGGHAISPLLQRAKDYTVICIGYQQSIVRIAMCHSSIVRRRASSAMTMRSALPKL